LITDIFKVSSNELIRSVRESIKPSVWQKQIMLDEVDGKFNGNVASVINHLVVSKWYQEVEAHFSEHQPHLNLRKSVKFEASKKNHEQCFLFVSRSDSHNLTLCMRVFML